jgi:hypothetical protein
MKASDFLFHFDFMYYDHGTAFSCFAIVILFCSSRVFVLNYVVVFYVVYYVYFSK